MANRLESETSPYLLSHADNPVDWYPWGKEAFDRAAAADKPVFVSIGYAACHWCHVMAHESFENPEIAALMNERFVNVKVDREEHPDVDAVYMGAIQIMGQGGGWPLSAFCTPDGKPYFVGTYFPPTDRHGRPGFPRLLRMLADAYAQEREKVDHNTEGVLEGLRQMDDHFRSAARDADASTLEMGTLITAGRQLADKCDPQHGGFGGKPKFPSSPSHALLAIAGRLKFGDPAREAFLRQAKHMVRGGIYDHLGGGFARYSVDEKWLVPHFEKMLYDNGQLLGICADAYAMTGEAEYVQVIEATRAWLERELSCKSGGLYASLDADSEGQEGKFYVWTPAQVTAVLGPVAAIQFNAAYGVSDAGNFEHGTSVLSRVSDLGAGADEQALAQMRRKLLDARAQRVRPATDTKVLAGWNALAVTGLVRAWQATGDAACLALARRVATFVATEMVHDGDRLWRTFKDGVKKLDGTVDDYAFCAAAFLDLAEATGDASVWQRGVALIEAVLDRFYEQHDGVGIFYLAPPDPDGLLAHRPESNHDGALPAGAAVAVECLLRVGLMCERPDWIDIAERYLAGRLGGAATAFAAARLLAALDLYLHHTELVVSPGDGRDALLLAARASYSPALMVAGSWAAPSLVDGKAAGAGKEAQAYVCKGMTCAAPVSDADALVELLADA